MNRVKFSGALMERDIESVSIEDMLSRLGGVALPINGTWAVMVGMIPHTGRPQEVYKLKLADGDLMLVEEWTNDKYEHPIELVTDDINCLELGYIPATYIVESIVALLAILNS